MTNLGTNAPASPRSSLSKATRPRKGGRPVFRPTWRLIRNLAPLSRLALTAWAMGLSCVAQGRGVACSGLRVQAQPVGLDPGLWSPGGMKGSCNEQPRPWTSSTLHPDLDVPEREARDLLGGVELQPVAPLRQAGRQGKGRGQRRRSSRAAVGSQGEGLGSMVNRKVRKPGRGARSCIRACVSHARRPLPRPGPHLVGVDRVVKVGGQHDRLEALLDQRAQAAAELVLELLDHVPAERLAVGAAGVAVAQVAGRELVPLRARREKERECVCVFVVCVRV